MALQLDISHPLRAFRLEVDLAVEDETLALVGPSGAGKTSVLRVLAGLVRPERGRVALGDEVWLDTVRGVDVPPEARRIGMVFQEYALFPHMSVRKNVAFGGGARGVDDLLERLRLSHLADAAPATLSGGERQRVALARALARRPSVLVLDEPLAALDTHTRSEVRAELRAVIREAGLPTVIVSHDFEDAATLADRVGVIVDGRILQLASASDLVARPADPFVASFAGATLLAGTAVPGPDGLTEVSLDIGVRAWSADAGAGRVALSIYPWEVSIGREEPSDTSVNHIRAPIVSLVELGNRIRVRVGPLAADVTAASVTRLGLREGDVVVASFKATAARLLPL